jgi:carbamoyltransferase
MIEWGISANSHDAALAVFDNNTCVFASHAERFSRIKNDAHLNQKLIGYALEWGEPARIAWYEKPFQKTLRQWRAGQGWLLDENNIKKYVRSYSVRAPIKTVSHHHSHAAAGYYTSPFQEATVICIDAIGEWETLSVWDAKGTKLKRIFSQNYPDSIGLWYSAMTKRIGLRPNEDEYILMGMAAYGDSTRFFSDIIETFFKKINQNSPRIKFKHNLHKGCDWWRSEYNSKQDLYDIAASTQAVYQYLLKIISNWARSKSPSGNLVLTGGCALNCAANSCIASDWNDVWIMPNPGDAGNAYGAVLALNQNFTEWQSPYLGYNIDRPYPVDELVKELEYKSIAGVANGRAEYGPRALGNRSLLADPRGPDIKHAVNRIKKRQQFRPFAPAILEEHAADYFSGPVGPYMQFTARCRYPEEFPAIVHKDGTSRVQTVGKQDNPGFRRLLEAWYERTGCPMLLNTSLNIKGKPIVNTEQDARDFEIHYGVKVW